MHQHAHNPQYIALTAKWQKYKELEQLANLGRAKVEREIMELVGDDLREKGVNHLPNKLSITTGIDEKYEQEEIDSLYTQWREGLLKELPFFPFKCEWKPDSAKISTLKETMPVVFSKIFRNALTIKPKKPSFSIKEK